MNDTNKESLINVLKEVIAELLYPCDDSLTDQEVDAELNRLGIDMKPAFHRLHKMIEVHRAKAQFAFAKESSGHCMASHRPRS